jgi:hypothetical protein
MQTFIMAIAAIYLIHMALLIKTSNFAHNFRFKQLPMAIGAPLAFLAFGRLMGWPM